MSNHPKQNHFVTLRKPRTTVMKRKTVLPVLLTTLLVIVSCTSEPAVPTEAEATESVIALERKALDNWSAGHPGGYATNMSSDATYMDDIGAHYRKDGLEEVQIYLNSLEGMIPKHNYEMEDTKVQYFGDVAVLTFRYQGFVDGQPGQPWKATSVYHFSDEEWKAVHAHWSLVKEEPEP
jgi:hypothetical protein